MSRPANWNVDRHATRLDVAPATPPLFPYDAMTSACSCGWRSKTHDGPDAAKRARAAGGGHLAAATRRAQAA